MLFLSLQAKHSKIEYKGIYVDMGICSSLLYGKKNKFYTSGLVIMLSKNSSSFQHHYILFKKIQHNYKY